jgi:hypothetical protein
MADTALSDARTTFTPSPGIAYVRVEAGGDCAFQMAVDEIRLGTTWLTVSGPVTGVANLIDTRPTSIDLSQNYPNPFNPTTKISYTLKNNGLVSLKVYDLLGRQVSVLVNEVQTAGSHQVTFAGSHLTSGVYFYRLENAGTSMTKKMLLLK